MTIFFNNLKRIFRKKSNYIIMFVVPVAFIILISSMSNSGSGKMVVGVVDKDNTKLTEKLKDSLNEKCTVKEISEDKIKNAIIDKDLDTAVVIKSGFTKDILNGGSGKIDMYSIKGVSNDSSVKLYINSFVNAARNIAAAAKGDSDKFYSGLAEYKKGSFTSDISYTDGKKERVETSFSQIGFLVMSMLFLTTMATTLILKDKEDGVYNRIFSNGVTSGKYMFQCILSFIVVAVIQVASILLIMKKGFNSDLGPAPVKLFVVLTVFAIVCVALGVAICNSSKDLKQANAIIALVSTPFCMLGGCFWPRDIMGGTMQKIGDFVPTTWAMEAANKILNGGSLMDASKEIGVMVLFIAIFFILSIVKKIDIAK